MDSGLIDELNAACVAVGGVKRLLPAEESTLIDRIARDFIQNPSMIRWWASLRFKSVRFPYGHGSPWDELQRVLADWKTATLVVTDDEAPPWPAYRGSCSAIVEVLQNCRFFEYFLVAPDVSMVVFDTHMNDLITTRLPQ